MKRNLRLLAFFIFTINLMSCNGQNKIKNESEPDLNLIYNKILKDSVLVTGWYYLSLQNTGFKRKLDKSEKTFYVIPKPIVVKGHFKQFKIYETDFKGEYPDYVGLTIKLNKSGSEKWTIATEKAIGMYLGLIINDKLVNAPFVNSQITNGMTALNRDVYDKKEIETFLKQIQETKN